MALFDEQLGALKEAVATLQSGGQMSEPDARQMLFSQAMADAVAHKAEPEEVYNSYPQAVKDYFQYTPADLKRQQTITIAGLALSIVGLLGWAGFGLRAAFLALRAWRAGQGLLAIAKVTAVPAIISAGFKQILNQSQIAVNNLNDVFHWGPIFGQQNMKTLQSQQAAVGTSWVTNFGKLTEAQIDALLSNYQKLGYAGINNPFALQTQLLNKDNLVSLLNGLIGEANAEGEAPTPAEVIAQINPFLILGAKVGVPTLTPLPAGVTLGEARETGIARMTQSKTAKPKMFLGTIFGGRVADVPDFVRQVDDKITSESDLVADAQINMTRWLAALPDRLTYEIQIKNNPFDEHGVRKIGTWATLALYMSSLAGKRLFIDEVLLGPLDAVTYFPETSRIESIQFELPKSVVPIEIKPQLGADGKLMTVDEGGRPVSGFFETPRAVSIPAQAPPGAPAPAAQLPPPGTVTTIQATPSSPKWYFFLRPGIIGQPNTYVGPFDSEEAARAAFEQYKSWHVQGDFTERQTYTAAPAPLTSPTSILSPAGAPAGFPRTVTVNVDELRVRAAPNTSAPLSGSNVLNRGDVFVAVAYVTGESIDGENRWWLSQRGNYVWTGGTAEKPWGS